MNNTTKHGEEDALMQQIRELQEKLWSANETIDEKMRKLEALGIGTTNITTQLENVLGELAAARRELQRLQEREKALTSASHPTVSESVSKIHSPSMQNAELYIRSIES
jgi:predicted  nucleic acid-binding Zn-ribbon protein